MSAVKYLNAIQGVLGTIKTKEAGEDPGRGEDHGGSHCRRRPGLCIRERPLGHPRFHIFPRYGSFVGFFPLYDPRLMWSNVIGPGGARELLWLERQEGYAKVFLQSYPLEPRDAMLVFSHWRPERRAYRDGSRGQGPGDEGHHGLVPCQREDRQALPLVGQGPVRDRRRRHRQLRPARGLARRRRTAGESRRRARRSRP